MNRIGSIFPDRTNHFAVLLFLAGLLIFIPVSLTFSVSNEENSSDLLYIDLCEYQPYAKVGFEYADTLTAPDISDPAWRYTAQSEYTAVSRSTDSFKHFFPEYTTRKFLSPFKQDEMEFTLVIPFEVGAGLADYLDSGTFIHPGMYLSGIGDNWQVFLNGALVREEMHLAANGHIKSHRIQRGVKFAFDVDLLNVGQNILAFHFVGDPSNTDVGLFYSSLYYIDDYDSILTGRSDLFSLLLFSVCVFVGLYHFLLYFIRRKEKHNLYYSLFTFTVGIYFVLRTASISHVIYNSAIGQRLEYISLYAIMLLLPMFLEQLTLQKVLLPTKIYGGICAVLAAAQMVFPICFSNDALAVWGIMAIPMILYMTVYDIFYRFFSATYHKWKTEAAANTGKHGLGKKILRDLANTPLGNIAITGILLAATSVYDTLDYMFMHTGLLISRYSFFLFTISAAFILARQFANQYSRESEIKTILEQSNAKLEATVKERTRELAKQVEIAKAASQAKSEFMATMSHELRTPLNAIIGLSEIELADKDIPKTDDGTDERTQINLQKISASGKTLLLIINDILHISKIEAGSLELIPVEYVTPVLIAETVALNVVRIGNKPIKFELSVDKSLPVKLHGDELRVKQIMNNLLSNAIKYTQKGCVRLKITCERDGASAWIIFSVSDTGIGIRAEDINKIFTEYSQLDTKANRKIEGTGLGLSITKRLIDMMGGTIRITSEYGAGSEFAARIPQLVSDPTPIGSETAKNLELYHRYESEKVQVQQPEHIRFSGAKILVVDDVEINLDVAAGLMEYYGIQVDCVLSGKEAIRLVRSEQTRYDMIMMDHMMPEMDGIEATRIIRNKIGSDYAKTVPIVALTANALVGNKDMFLENGFSDFISKPIESDHLEAVLTKWIKNTGV